MSEEKKNQMLEILARKKAQQGNKGGFNPHDAPKGKINTKGFGGPAVTRKTGRGS